jgi:hypothetical protein
MTVYSDVLGHCSGCTTTVARFVTYQVRNLTNSLATNIPIGENVTTSGWNCQQTDPGNATTPCSAGTRTGAAAEFTDEWALSSDSFTPVGCGDNVDGHWLWCPTGRSIGHLSGYVHTNAVKINGVVSPPNTFAQGTIINP